MRHFLFLIVVLFLSSCVAERGATNYFVNKHPDKFAKLASAMFPVKEKLVPGKPVIIRDTIKGDSVNCPPATKNPATGEMQPGKVKCPDAVKETIHIRDTVFLENSALVASLNLQLIKEIKLRTIAETNQDNLDKQLKALGKSYTWLLYIIGALALIIFFLSFLFFRN